jgi:hypothetical protein
LWQTQPRVKRVRPQDAIFSNLLSCNPFLFVLWPCTLHLIFQNQTSPCPCVEPLGPESHNSLQGKAPSALQGPSVVCPTRTARQWWGRVTTKTKWVDCSIVHQPDTKMSCPRSTQKQIVHVARFHLGNSCPRGWTTLNQDTFFPSPPPLLPHPPSSCTLHVVCTSLLQLSSLPLNASGKKPTGSLSPKMCCVQSAHQGL